MKNLIYLASPYTHPEHMVQHDRFIRTCLAAAYLMERGHFVFSPIAHCHPLALVAKLPTSFDYWQNYNRLMIARCDVFYILQLAGYTDSKGVMGESEHAYKLGKPVYFMSESYDIIPPKS